MGNTPNALLRKSTAVITALALASSVFLSGCVEDDTMPVFSEESMGIVDASTVVTAADESPQYLDEYGVFYSTNRDDIVAITGQSYSSSPDDDVFIIRDGVVQRSVTYGGQIAAKQSGTLSMEITDLAPGTTYYFRFYTIGRDSEDTKWLSGLQVASYTTRKPPHEISKPVAPTTMRKGKSATIYGYLKPEHEAGSTSAVRIYRYKRRSDGTYAKYDSLRATLSDYSTYSKYKRSLSFPSKGKWRIRAYAPADDEHAAAWSSYRYVTVK